jgi:hypothetical protein
MTLGSVGANGHILQSGLLTICGKVARDGVQKNKHYLAILAYKGYD